MKTVQGIIRDGQVHPREPLQLEGPAHCLITIFDEDVEALHRLSQEKIDDTKQTRLSLLLQMNKTAKLSEAEERDLDALLTEVYQLTAKRARAARLLEQFHFV